MLSHKRARDVGMPLVGVVRFQRFEADQMDGDAPTRSFARGGEGGPFKHKAIGPSEVAKGPAPATDGDMPLHMPAPKAIAAEDISRVGVEGMPGDPRSGPGMLRLELVALLVIFLLVAVGTAVWLGWAAGLAMLGWVGLSVVFNPVFWATMLRIKDRRRVTHEERANAITVRSTHSSLHGQPARGTPAH